MSSERYKRLLESYGANPELWPESERLLYQKLTFEEVVDAKRLDQVLATYPEAEANLNALKQTIFNKTIYRQTAIDVLMEWLKPSESFWRPALVTALPILLGVSVGFLFEFDSGLSLEEEMSIMGLSQLEVQYE